MPLSLASGRKRCGDTILEPMPMSATTAAAGDRVRSTVLAVAQLRKSYGATTAVDGVSFSVGHNEIEIGRAHV